MMCAAPFLPRIALAMLALCLCVSGLPVAVEGWRLEPMAAYGNAQWWGVAGGGLPADPAVWRPGRQNGRDWAGYSQAVLDAAAGCGPAAAEYVREARTAALHALTLAPAQPSVWARLSVIELNLGRSSPARDALLLSWQTGPDLRSLAWLRTRLGLYLWDRLPDGAKSHAGRDLARLWRQPAMADLPYPRQALVRFAHGIGRLDAVRETLPEREHALLAERIQSVLMETAGAR